MEDPSQVLFGGGSEALSGCALPQIGKMRFGSCVGEVAFPPLSYTSILVLHGFVATAPSLLAYPSCDARPPSLS